MPLTVLVTLLTVSCFCETAKGSSANSSSLSVEFINPAKPNTSSVYLGHSMDFVIRATSGVLEEVLCAAEGKNKFLTLTKESLQNETAAVFELTAERIGKTHDRIFRPVSNDLS